MTYNKDKISIEPFNGDQSVADEVAKLHLDIRFGQIQDGTNSFHPEVTDIYDSQDDLKNMQEFYINPGGNFWIARDKNTGKIVGFVGLKKQSKEICKLKRMAVIESYRQQGIGQSLGEELINWAKNHGFKQVTLATGVNEKAHSLYKKLGFVDNGYGKGGADYRMKLDLT